MSTRHSDLREMLRIVTSRGIGWVVEELRAQGLRIAGESERVFWGVFNEGDYETNEQLLALYALKEDAELHKEAMGGDLVQEVKLNTLPACVVRGERQFRLSVDLATGRKVECVTRSGMSPDLGPWINVNNWMFSKREEMMYHWSGWARPDEVETVVEKGRQEYVAKNGLPKPEERGWRQSDILRDQEAKRKRLAEGMQAALKQAYRDLEADGRPVAKVAAAELKERGVVSLGTSKALAAERAADAPSSLLVVERAMGEGYPIAERCAHGKLRPGRICPTCQLVGKREDFGRQEKWAWLEHNSSVDGNWHLRWMANGTLFDVDLNVAFVNPFQKIVNFEHLLESFGLQFDRVRVVEIHHDRMAEHQLQQGDVPRGIPSDGSTLGQRGPEAEGSDGVEAMAGGIEPVQGRPVAAGGEDSGPDASSEAGGAGPSEGLSE